jgi:hypothetical protein
VATAGEVRELIEKMEAERAALLTVVGGIDEAQAELRPPEGDGEAGWSVKEQLAHLAQMEATYRAWVERAVAEERPDLSEGTAPEVVAYALEGAHGATLAQHAAELRRQRERTLAVIQRLDADAFERTARSPMFGELTVMQWLRSYYRHDRMHHAQIEGRESDYRPRFAGGVEPDQRGR